jgi:hypothetical protein
MPNLEDNSLQGAVLGDTMKVFRTITLIPAIGDSAGSTATLSVVKAWFTLKPTDRNNDVDDSTAIFQKEITTTDVPGVGQILVAGSGTGDNRQARFRFDLNPDDTWDLAPGTEYPWDIQLLFDDGSINTPFKGLLTGVHGVTNKTA